MTFLKKETISLGWSVFRGYWLLTKGLLVSIEEYRHLMNDFISTDERIAQRLQYLEALCRNVIRNELRGSDKMEKK